ncbi:acetyltransferase [Poronia punctata]|nr:acetyltransferase [Poronia punctata]
MGTPFLSFLPPTGLRNYDRNLPHDKQSSDIPAIFRDAMCVREEVFVEEQGWPLAMEHDDDDERSCHWVTYASVNRTVSPEVRDPETGEVVRSRRSTTVSLPIGTLRIVPFPHPPHPQDGARYVDDVLQPDVDDGGHDGAGEDGAGTNDGSTETGAAVRGRKQSLLGDQDKTRQTSARPFGRDRATDFHDGKEPYVKLGRLAVAREYRGHRVAERLWNAAKKWLQDNPTYFNPSITVLGMETMRAETVDDIPRWKGLVCVHAQQRTVKVYEGWGFQVDHAMGTWYEQGIPHVGMFLRLEIREKSPQF